MGVNRRSPANASGLQQPDEPEEPGEVAEDEPSQQSNQQQAIVPTKLHVRGLETLHTEDIRNYVKAHFGALERVEWIDDTAANLVFSSGPTARDALRALSTIEIADVTALAAGETLPAKPMDGRPQISLQMRFAVEGDRKQVGAALRSRYYLLHPEHDPEEKRRRNLENRSRYRERDGGRRQTGRQRRDSDDKVETFEASMYDDAPSVPTKRRHSDLSDRPASSYSQENRGKELFVNRKLKRERSASPRRERGRPSDGDDLMSNSARNRGRARLVKENIATSSRSKELFPDRSAKVTRLGGGQLDELERAIGSARLKDEDRPKIVETSSGSAFNIRGTAAAQRGQAPGGFAIRGTAVNARELFPSRLGESNAGKELLDRPKRRKAEDLFG